MNVPDSAIRCWTILMANRSFESEVKARQEIFKICENHSRRSLGTRNVEEAFHKNRAFARAVPLYQEDDQWKVGLQEYASMTSDFSDGTSGEPSAPGSHSGDGNTAVGLPDYKYLERLKSRRKKLAALRRRRDPANIDKPLDPDYLQKMLQHSLMSEAAPDFETWFAGSQVVDGGGRPMPVYHSTPYSFRKFDTSAEGAHFGSYDQASNLRKPGKREPKAYFLSLKNPLRMQDIGGWNHFSNLHSNLAREDLINDEQTERAWQAWQRSDAEGWETLKQALKENGYDGIVYENEQEGPGDSWIAFWASQIRPARVQVRENQAEEEDDFEIKELTSASVELRLINGHDRDCQYTRITDAVYRDGTVEYLNDHNGKYFPVTWVEFNGRVYSKGRLRRFEMALLKYVSELPPNNRANFERTGFDPTLRSIFSIADGSTSISSWDIVIFSPKLF